MARARRSVKKKPHFFKILLRDFARRLWLPPRFVGDHLRGSPNKAVVHDVGGGAWDVALEKTDGGAFLSGGWAKFVEDHALQEHDFVVFRYDGDMHFTVVLSFDRTACEKDTVSGGEELSHESSPCPEGEEEEDTKVSLDLKYPVAVPGRDVPEVVKHSGGYIPRPYRIRKGKMQDGAPFPFCSSFPYFISAMRRSEIFRPRLLRLPASFSWAYTPSTRTCVTLGDSNGSVWTVNFILSKLGRFFSGGWTAFTRDNNLREGDYCAFELVAPATFKVTVIRADEVRYRRIKGCRHI